MSKSLNAVVADVVEPAGFARSAKRPRVHAEWVRKRDGYVHIIDIQVSGDPLTAALNLRVRDESLSDVLIAEDPERNVFLAPSIDLRLGRLLGATDRWWRRSDPADQAEVGAALGDRALPFFDRVSSTTGMVEYLESTIGPIKDGWLRPRLDLAYLHLRLGNPGRGLDLIAAPPRRYLRNPNAMARVEAARRACEASP